MQGAALILMTIMGCDDTVTQCHHIETVDTRWETIQQCDAATEAQLARFGDEQYPVIVAACETALADATLQDTAPEGTVVTELAPDAKVPPAPIPDIAQDDSDNPDTDKRLVARLMTRVTDILPDADSIKSLAAKPAHVVTDTYAWVVKKL